MDDDRLITSSMRMEDTDIEQSLRPMSLSEYIGQDKVKESMSIYSRLQNKGERLWTMILL